jgi:hypothetical protein
MTTADDVRLEWPAGLCGHPCRPRSASRLCEPCEKRWRKAGYPLGDDGNPVVPELTRAKACERCGEPVPPGRKKFCSLDCCQKGPRAVPRPEQECALPDCHERFTPDPNSRQRFHDPKCARRSQLLARQARRRRQTAGKWIY